MHTVSVYLVKTVWQGKTTKHYYGNNGVLILNGDRITIVVLVILSFFKSSDITVSAIAVQCFQVLYCFVALLSVKNLSGYASMQKHTKTTPANSRPVAYALSWL